MSEEVKQRERYGDKEIGRKPQRQKHIDSDTKKFNYKENEIVRKIQLIQFSIFRSYLRLSIYLLARIDEIEIIHYV